jgi:Tol biopolymer transport system component
VALVRVDLDGETPPGEPVLLDSSIANGAGLQVSASADGKVIVLLGGDQAALDLTLLDRTGKKVAVASSGASGSAGHPEFSPDGKRLAFEIPGTAATEDVWVYDIARQATSRLTFADGLAPAWSASGDRVFYYSERSGKKSGIYEIGSNGVGTEKLVAAVPAHHVHASPDGKLLAFEKTAGAAGGDIGIVSLDGSGKQAPLLTGQRFLHPRFSPDSRFLAYNSSETGRPEVYIQTMPPGGGKWQVSTNGGSEPRWRSDGKELYFLAGNSMMAAAISLRGSAVEVGEIKQLFEARRGAAAAGHYASSPDGKFFVMSLVNEQAQDRPITLLLNWKLP